MKTGLVGYKFHDWYNAQMGEQFIKDHQMHQDPSMDFSWVSLDETYRVFYYMHGDHTYEVEGYIVFKKN